MKFVKQVWKNIKTHKIQSILCVMTAFLMAAMLDIYAGNIREAQSQLASLPELLPVYGYITNLSGTRLAGLEIPEEMVHKFEQSELVRGVRYTIRLLGGEGNVKMEDWETDLRLTMAAAGDIRSIQDAEGAYLENINEMLKSEEKVCAVTPDAMKEYGWALGDEVLLTVYYYYISNRFGEMKCLPLTTEEFTIEAVMEGEERADEYAGVEIVFPIGTVRNLFHEKGLSCNADSLSFYVRDPLSLNQFKQEMQGWGLLPVAEDAAMSLEGAALRLRDSDFTASASYLYRELDILNGFLPAAALLVFWIAYVASYLMAQKRKEEFLLYRLLGLPKRNTIFLLFVEQVVPACFGVLLCYAAGYFFQQDIKVHGTEGLLLIAGYAAGCLGAWLRFAHAGEMRLMSLKE